MIELLPITLLSGLQGAGKSSLLANALTQEHGMKVFAVVETLEQLNALAEHPKCTQVQRTKPNQLQFPNGCMCVALPPQDLLLEVANLANSGSYSCCIIADPGTSEPMKVATALTFAPLSLTEDTEHAAKQQQQQQQQEQQFKEGHKGCGSKQGGCSKAKAGTCDDACKANGCRATHRGDPDPQQGAAASDCELTQGKDACRKGCCSGMDGPTLMSVCRLDTCMTVVDVSTLASDLTSIEEMADRRPEGDQRNVATLLVEMVEFADVVVLNKTDLVKKDVLSGTHELVAALNPGARILETSHGGLPVKDIVCTGAFDLDKTSRSAGWLRALDATHPAKANVAAPHGKGERAPTCKGSVASFVYTARKPFHPGRLYRNFMRKYFLTRVIDSESDDSDGSESGSEEGSEESDEGMQVKERGPSTGKEFGNQEHSRAEGGNQCCGSKACGQKEQQQEAKQQEAKQGKADKMSVEGSGSGDEEEEDEDESMEEALADYAAARDTVLATAKKELGEVVRSKGFCWLATQDDSIIGWDNVGALLQVMKEGCWFACVPEDEWPNDEAALKRILADFSPNHPEMGDRRQEIAFIGKDLKEHAIRSMLDTCLATEEEVAAAKEGKLRDELFGGEDEEGSDDSGSEEREELTLEEARQLLDARAADKKRSGKKART
ncbi:hypothetical protein DUNSADRAFT_14343 [Dunaliella salina]|uniref:CobW C-terminal domain-containing protein n=1 Tax=Dunaliella salina TaxID=3046 RepID=A0ABQ7G7J1_DUNSA|nr:hypothetical protein DUNSADRAFT_14343 [Dunaliella salina]|eukprot:KAF5830577.1 hypothetical protein DUNSADRAFT_14343 [Dunaliella salina]